MMEEGRMHLRFVISLYCIQLAAGRHFSSGAPCGAQSWKDYHMVKLLDDYKIETVISHQCKYGLLTPGPGGVPAPAKKPTKWASDSPFMLRRLSRRCSGKHKHQHIERGRPAAAALYPLRLITEILRGMRDTTEHQTKHYDDDDDEALLNPVMALNSGFGSALTPRTNPLTPNFTRPLCNNNQHPPAVCDIRMAVKQRSH